MRGFAVLFSILLTGCSSIHSFKGPDGRDTLMAVSPNILGAYQELSKACGHSGYHIISQYQDHELGTGAPLFNVMAQCK
ncbi:MAG: hypothetical protein ACRC6V_06660 [Bacteroidales bacterium]